MPALSTSRRARVSQPLRFAASVSVIGTVALNAIFATQALAQETKQAASAIPGTAGATGNAGNYDPANLAKHPLTDAHPEARAALEARVRAEMSAPPASVTADPCAAYFPGSVGDSAARISRAVIVDTAVPNWHSTGLYAAPGDRITVTVPASAAGQKLSVRIGAHKDELWKLPKWTRAPEITRAFPLDTTETLAANAFGGPVYIVVPQNCALGKVTVTINGAVAAPYFVKGVTTAQEWKAIRNSPAPWAELQGDKVILTVPASTIRNLDDPQAVMVYWDEVADTAADLYAIPHERKRPERYCTDQQISAGYMHSGYPIMTWLDVAPRFTDISVLRGNDGGKTWGFYHELGHNHQQRDWTWAGMTEVTNNLLSLYGGEKLNHVPADYSTTHGAIAPAKRHENLVAYLASGPAPDGETASPWLALTMFVDLREAFGWEPFTKVFGEYQALAPGAHPKTETDKHDQFMVRFSQAVGKNLGPYFTAWGLTTSDTARQSIANLSSWMPADWPSAQDIEKAKSTLKTVSDNGK